MSNKIANPEEKDDTIEGIGVNLDEDDEVDETAAAGTGEAGTEADATAADVPTTANCTGDNFKYKPGKPIVSITFSLSSEQPFAVNVGTFNKYDRSEKKAFPVLCEVRDLTGGSDDVKITSLKNKACIAKNLPAVLAPVLTQLNELLLDQYTAYYEPTKYEAFVDAQDKFLKESTKGPTPESKKQDTSTEEMAQGAQVFVAEGRTVTPEQLERSKIIQTLIQKLKDKSDGEKIQSVNDEKLPLITKQNGVDLPTLKTFLEKHEEVFPLYSLNLKYGEKIVFMTNDGVLTDGEIILPYTGLDMVNKKISANTFNWTFTTDSDYQEALKVLSGEVERIGYIDTSKISKEGVYKGGKRKTLSKKLLKRVTKRNRK